MPGVFNLSVDEGEVVCILGPSGSGKSTFLRCINHLETLTEGLIWVDGEVMCYYLRGEQLHEMHARPDGSRKTDGRTCSRNHVSLLVLPPSV